MKIYKNTHRPNVMLQDEIVSSKYCCDNGRICWFPKYKILFII